MLRPRPVPLPTSLVVKNGSNIYLRFSRYPCAGVGDRDINIAVGTPCLNGNRPCRWYGMRGIHQDIHKDLVQLADVASSRRNNSKFLFQGRFVF